MALVLAATSTLIADSAAACHDQDGDARTVVCFTTLHAAAATLAFSPAGIYYASERSWLPPGWAWPQLVFGGLFTIGGSITAIALAANDSPNPGLDVGWALGTMALGGFYGSVATFSLERYQTPPSKDNDAAGQGLVPRIVAVPAPRGDGVMVMAAF